MPKLSDLLTSAAAVRNESTAEQNTALRVGNVLYSLTQYLQQYTSMADITLQVSDVGATITAKFQSGDDRLFQKTIALPVASSGRAGILTAEAFAAFQSDISKLQQDLTTLFNEKEVLEDRVNVNAENIADLGLALRGKSANSSAYYDPFISLGDSADWTEFSGKLNALSEQKYMGRCRAKVDGVTVEVYQFINNFEKKDYTQVLLGNVSAVGSGVTFTPNQFNIIHRHRKDGVWLSWQRINDHPIATPSLDGLMSAADKTALNSIDSAFKNLEGMNFIEASEYCANFDNIIEKVGGGAIRFSKPTIFTFSGAGSEQGIIINSPSSGGLITQFAFLKASTNGGFSRRFIQYNINSLTITKVGDWRPISDLIPAATTSAPGLMSKEDKSALEKTKTDIVSLDENKATKSALNTANTAISDLRYRLQGRADMNVNCSAYTDPFISLGDLANWPDFNDKLNAISDKKYMGRCRARVDGVTVEVYQFINSFSKVDYTQMLFGNVSAGSSGVTFTPNKFSILYRQYKDSAWSAWQRMATATELATLEARIAALETRLS